MEDVERSGHDNRPGAPPPTSPAAGWYPDPVTPGQHRFWSGTAWTSHTFPDGPASPAPSTGSVADASGQPPGAAGPYPTAGSTDRPPADPSATGDLAGNRAGNPAAGALHAESDIAWREPTAPPAARPRRGWWRRRWGPPTVVAAVVALGGATAFALGSPTGATGTPAAAASLATTPTLRATAEAATVAGSQIVRKLVLHTPDVPSNTVIALLKGGNKVKGQTTLDLCNGTYASEKLRTNRLQVVALDSQGNPVVSTEAVLYTNAAATKEAFAELRHVAATCPNHPVVSPVGEGTLTTHFGAPPDKSWPNVATVTRQAYSFTSTDPSGNSQRSVAVYLRRGRVLLGLYFTLGSARPKIAGQTTIEGIVNVFAKRIAALPAAEVNG